MSNPMPNAGGGREMVLVEHARLIEWVVGRSVQLGYDRVNSVLDRDDIRSVVTMALLAAWERYEPGRGVEFRTYAASRMIGAVTDELRRTDHLSRGERRKQGQTSVTARLAPTQLHEVVSIDGDSEEDVRAQLAEGLGRLTEREIVVVCLRYLASMNVHDIGALIHVSESRVTEILAAAVARMSRPAKHARRTFTGKRGTPVRKSVAEKACEAPDGTSLTVRQLQVLVAYSEGLHARETASRIGIGVETVKHHRTLAIRALGARNLANGIDVAWRRGILPVGQ